jgi:hypothetical protein
MMELLPRRAPQTWRDFLLRVAAIAVAALVVLAAINLFTYLHDASTPGPRTPHIDSPS